MSDFQPPGGRKWNKAQCSPEPAVCWACAREQQAGRRIRPVELSGQKVLAEGVIDWVSTTWPASSPRSEPTQSLPAAADLLLPVQPWCGGRPTSCDL